MALWSPSSSPCPIPSPIPSISPATLVALTLSQSMALVSWDTREILSLKHGIEPSCLSGPTQARGNREMQNWKPSGFITKGSNISVYFAPVESCPENSQPWPGVRRQQE